MKWVFVVLLFLVLVGGVSAMNGPIKVMTDSGNRVSVFIWTSGGGPILNSDSGAVDSDGVFVTKTFFSLKAPYKLNVVIVDADLVTDTFEKEITGLEFDDGMDVDCRSGNCIVFASEILVNDSNESAAVVNESNDSVVGVVNGSDNVSGDVVNATVDDILLTGRSLFFNKDGSVNWISFLGGIVVLFLLLVSVVMMFRNGRLKKAGLKKEKVVLDDDEKELEDMEEKVKETEEKIKKVKDGKMRRTKIYEAKLKLAEEEKELSELEDGGNDDRVGKQEKVVEKAEDIVEEAKDSD